MYESRTVDTYIVRGYDRDLLDGHQSCFLFFWKCRKIKFLRALCIWVRSFDYVASGVWGKRHRLFEGLAIECLCSLPYSLILLSICL